MNVGPLIKYYKNKKIEEQKTEETKAKTTPAKQERNVTVVPYSQGLCEATKPSVANMVFRCILKEGTL